MKDIRNNKFNKSLSNPFKSVIKNWYPNAQKLFYIKNKWEDIVGKEISENTQLLGVYDEGFLSVACKSSSWASELNLKKNFIIKQINLIFGADYIRKINFSTAKYVRREKSVPAIQIAEEIILSQEKLDEIDKKLESFPDEELKAKIKQIYINLAKNEIREKQNEN